MQRKRFWKLVSVLRRCEKVCVGSFATFFVLLTLNLDPQTDKHTRPHATVHAG